MAQVYRFAVVRLSPDSARDERLNLAVVVFSKNGLDLRIGRHLDKVRAISGALDSSRLRELFSNLERMDEGLRQEGLHEEARAAAMIRVGPLTMSSLGTFRADTFDEYEARVASVLRSLIDAEPALPRVRRKNTKLLTQMKAEFRREHVLAKGDEDLESHRIVAGYELDEGLVADLVLRNGAMHVVETVDVSDEEASLRRAVTDIAVSALVLERARMRFGEGETRARLVYSASSDAERLARPSLDAAAHQGAELVNWASTDERNRFLHALSSLAIPRQKKTRRGTVRFEKPVRLF